MPGFDFMDENGEPSARRHHRFAKRGSATLRRAVTSAPHPGSVFDLSLGGCLVWLEAPFPFEPAVVIELNLHVDGLDLRVMAAVRYTADENRVVGLEFEPMGTRKAEQLTRFIDALQAAESPDTP